MLQPFFVWQNKVLKSVSLEDVILLEAIRNYTRIVLSNGKHYLVRSSLSSALQKLPADMFIKTHRSFAVSVLFIDNVARDHLTIGKTSVPIARQYYKKVMEQLNVID
jgi:DNA-binding LytR/AlgR family response regulator